MAMACLRLFTFFPERPLRNFPDLRSRIARFTFSPAFFPYRAMARPPTAQKHLTAAGISPGCFRAADWEMLGIGRDYL
jgi:hypothetical protein